MSTKGNLTADRVIEQLPERVRSQLQLTRQRQLLGKVLAVLLADERFLGAWLWGSISRGEADVHSDLDVYVVVDDSNHPALVSQWWDVLDRISPTVSKVLRPFGNTPILSALTPDWQHFDLILVPLAEIGQPIQYPWLLLFDRADVNRRLGPVRPEPVVSQDQLLPLVESFFWVLGGLTVPLGREDFLVGVEGAMLLRRTTIDLMLAENGSNQASILHRNQYLSPEQRCLLEALPPLAATRESVIAGFLACWQIFRPVARRLLEQHGLPYPAELERATLAHLRRSLGVPAQ